VTPDEGLERALLDRDDARPRFNSLGAGRGATACAESRRRQALQARLGVKNVVSNNN